MELLLKTEAPGLHGVGHALVPQAWPGTSLPDPAPLPSMYSRKSYVGGQGPGQGCWRREGALQRRKQGARGREQARTQGKA